MCIYIYKCIRTARHTCAHATFIFLLSPPLAHRVFVVVVVVNHARRLRTEVSRQPSRSPAKPGLVRTFFSIDFYPFTPPSFLARRHSYTFRSFVSHRPSCRPEQTLVLHTRTVCAAAATSGTTRVSSRLRDQPGGVPAHTRYGVRKNRRRNVERTETSPGPGAQEVIVAVKAMMVIGNRHDIR